MLPPPCHWIDSADASFLHWNYACIAKVTAEGVMSLHGYGIAREYPAASRKQGKYFVERFVAAHGMPIRGRGRGAR